jgi:hypothetical protein
LGDFSYKDNGGFWETATGIPNTSVKAGTKVDWVKQFIKNLEAEGIDPTLLLGKLSGTEVAE